MSRRTISLNGIWSFSPDPYYRAVKLGRHESPTARRGARADRCYPIDWKRIRVPGTWNMQQREWFHYTGNAVYEREFDFRSSLERRRTFLHFEAANYKAEVWLNGAKLGTHLGGFTPFSFDVTDHLRRRNHLFVQVENEERKERCPTVGPDWFNYGGLVRDVHLEICPKERILDHLISWDGEQVRGRISVTGRKRRVRVRIGDLMDEELPVVGGETEFAVDAEPSLWSPDDPYLYPVEIHYSDDVVNDQIGLRTIETDGDRLLLNGEDIRLKGISVHGECADGGRTMSRADMLRIFELARELGLNFLRLAHYPHDRRMARMADRYGVLLWEEIPVYWRIDWQNPDTLADAKNQLAELMARDRNRASVIIWSVANETPEDAEGRTEFLTDLARQAKETDPSRLVSLALFMSKKGRSFCVTDPIGEHVDVISINTYPLWYSPRQDIRFLKPGVYEKPHIISEWGAAAQAGLRGRNHFTEDYQAKVYKKITKILAPKDFIRGTSPWILADFRSMLRTNSVQKGLNLKGLVDITKRKKKLAFDVYKNWAFE
ncbi:MAG: glycoside hydrolase family 2 protein [Planctomycetota bacterium]